MAPGIASSAPTLQRRLGVWSAAALVVSNMIGTGIFTTTGFLAGDLGEAWLVLAVWVVGGAIALAGAMCYAELGINIARSGGEYAYLTRAFGPVWGFLSGWVSFFAGFSAPIAAAALAFSGYLAFVFPSLGAASRMYSGDLAGITWEVGPMQLVAASLVVVLALLNCLPVSQVARVQNVLTTIKVVVIGAFVTLGPAVGQGNWSNLAGSAERTSSTPLAGQFAVSLFWVMFGYAGWNAATYVAEEIEEPRRTLPRALMFGTLAVVVLYFALNVVFMFAVPLESLKGVVAVGALAATAMFGPQAAWLFSLLMALAIVSTVNAMTTIGPRVYYAMAKDGAFLAPAARLSRRAQVPVVAIASQAACAMVMCFTSFPQLVTYIGFCLTFFNVLAVASLFRFRRQSGWQRLPAVSVAFPLVPAAYLLVGVWMIYFGIRLRPGISTAAVVTLALGAVVFYGRAGLRASRPERDTRE